VVAVKARWQECFTELVSFITANPGIRVEEGTVPSDVREQFYGLFNCVRESYVEEKFALQLAKGRIMSNAWAEVNAGIKRAGFGPVEIPPELNWFMLNPLDGLRRSLYDLLFALIRGKIDILAFEQRGYKEVSEAFACYYRLGYIYWIQLALIVALQADKNYRVPVIDKTIDALMGEGHENPGDHLGKVPEMEECTNITFIQQAIVSFMVPRIVVHSTRMQKLLGLCTDFVEPQWRAGEVNSNLEWFNLSALLEEHKLEKPRPDYQMPIEFNQIMSDILVYAAHGGAEIGLVADRYNFLRPDWCLEIMECDDWYEKGELERIRKHHSVMKPRYGTYILCLEQPLQAAIDELAPKLQVIPDVVGILAAEGKVDMPSESDLLGDAEGTTLSPKNGVEQIQDIHLLHCGFDSEMLDMMVEVMSSGLTVYESQQ